MYELLRGIVFMYDYSNKRLMRMMNCYCEFCVGEFLMDKFLEVILRLWVIIIVAVEYHLLIE